MAQMMMQAAAMTRTAPFSVVLLAFLSILSATTAEYDGPICFSDNKVFHARVDLFAGELGYYVFEECGLDVKNPTIAMELGETYTFVQSDRTNYYHRESRVLYLSSL